MVGRIFWRGAVAALIEDDETLDPDLRRLEDRELVALARQLVDGRTGGARVQPHPHARRRLRKPARAASGRAHTPASRAGSRRRPAIGSASTERCSPITTSRPTAAPGATATTPSTRSRRCGCRAFELLLVASQNAIRGAAYRAARSLAETALELATSAEERASAFEALGHCARHAALGDDAWAAYRGAVDALRDADSPDHDRIGRLTGFALERSSGGRGR